MQDGKNSKMIQLPDVYRKRRITKKERCELWDYFNKFHLSLSRITIKLKRIRSQNTDLARYYQPMKQPYPEIPVVFNIRHPVCNIASIIEPNYDRVGLFNK